MVDIRPMKLKDLIKVRDLEIDCIKEYFSATIENRWEDLPQEWRDNLGASNRKSYQLYISSGLSFVAEEDGEVMGFIFAQMLHRMNGMENLAWIENMGVHPYFRRMGIGRMMVTKVAETARDMGASFVHCTIQPENFSSIKLHERMGFTMGSREGAFLDLIDYKVVPLRSQKADPITALNAGGIRERWDAMSQEDRKRMGLRTEDADGFYAGSELSLAAVDDGRIIGVLFAQMLHHVNNVENLVWIEDMGVDPDYRRMGMGFKLLRRLAENAKAMGSTAIHCSIAPRNLPAIMLHKKIGFFIDRRESAFLDLGTFRS